MILRKTQQLEIINKAGELGIDPKVFEIELVPEVKSFFGLFTETLYPETIFRIKDTNYYFSFITYDKPANVSYRITLSFSPDKELRKKKIEFITKKEEYQWKSVFEWYYYWLECLKEELEAIKDWNKLMAIPDFMGNNQTYSSYEENFTEDEKLLLVEGIYKFKLDLMDNFDLNQDELRIINEKLDDLAKKVDTLNKFDFRSAFYGILINLSSSILYDSAPLFWSTAKSIFGSFFGSNNPDLIT